MEISQNDLWILSYYRESELAGALIMGRLARETDDDELRVRLTEHCAEEAEHAWRWTRTILAVGGRPLRVRETYQSRYYAAVGQPSSLLEILALTQVFERRVMRHFRAHLRWPGTHPRVAETLRGMIADEVGHVGWVKDWLDRYARERGEAAVADAMRRYEEVDRRVYAGLLEFRERFVEVVGSGARPAAPAEGSLESRVRRTVAAALNRREEELRPDSPLEEVGIDSLDLAVALMAVEEAFRVELPPQEVEGIRTLSALAERIAVLRGEAPGRG